MQLIRTTGACEHPCDLLFGLEDMWQLFATIQQRLFSKKIPPSPTPDRRLTSEGLSDARDVERQV